MKKVSSILLFFLGFLFLSAFAVLRYKRDRDVYERKLVEQQGAVAFGWAQQWSDFLLEKARTGELPKTYTLVFNRTGTELKSKFFPRFPVKLDWDQFRQAADADARKIFLNKALGYEDSWDRVLAISAWIDAIGSLPTLELTSYEQTLIDDEAKTAFEQIFKLFDKGKDFSLSERRYLYDGVFYAITEDGNIEAFVPSSRVVQRKILPEFMAQQHVSAAKLNNSPWDIEFGTQASYSNGASLVYANDEWLLVALTMTAFSLGVFFLIDTTNEERRKLSRKVGFLNQVVHELKTPLTGLKLHVELMKKHGFRQESLNALEKSARKIDLLFTDITLLNREGEGDQMLDSIVTAEELDELVSALCLEFTGCAVDGSKFIFPVKGSKTGIEIVLRNLISNGVTYGSKVQLSWREGEQTVFMVKDQGPGIAKRDAKFIFKEFYRAEEARSKRPGGLGLGLAVAKKISHGFGADLSLTNPGEAGAEFLLCLARP